MAKIDKEGTYKKLGEVIAARRLPSGDVVLQASSVEAREKLEKEEWIKVVAPPARILRQTFPVLVHGVKVTAYKKEEQEEGIQKIKKHNRRLHPGLNIVRFSWLWAEVKKKDGKEKTHSSLLLEIATPEMANKVKNKSLIENYKTRDCEVYNRKYRILRLAVGLVKTRPNPRVPDPTGNLGNPTRPYPFGY